MNSANKPAPPTNNHWLAEEATLAQLNEVAGYVEDMCGTCQELNSDDVAPMSLKSAFRTEATKFMKKFHEERLKKVDRVLESESWRQTQVPVEFQSLVDDIVNSGTVLEERRGDSVVYDKVGGLFRVYSLLLDKFATYKVDTSSKRENKPAEILCVEKEEFVVIG